MPFEIVSQQAQKDVCPHAILGAVINWTNRQIDAFERAEGPLDLREVFVAAHRLFGR